jgi:CTP synthase
MIDSYKSLIEALNHGGLANKTNVLIKWIDAESLENANIHLDSIFKDINAIIVPGGFGKRGSEGKIKSIKYAREKKIPFFGICFGMQMAVLEFARNVLNFADASSSEFGNTSFPLIGLLTEWQTEDGLVKRSQDSDLGGTMRLGAYECNLTEGSLVKSIYKKDKISERHRHRYEVNYKYNKNFISEGFIFSGMSPDKTLPEICELNSHPWFIAVQFHPELKSKPFDPHPLFASYIEAALNQSRLL